MIALLFIFFALDAVAFAAPGEDALSQKAVEIARPFGFPITINGALARSLAQLRVKRRRRV